MAECLGILGKLLGHSYKPIYDVDHSFTGDLAAIKDIICEKDEETMLTPISGPELSDIISQVSSDKKVYIQSVCKRCGDVIKRG